jgi:hypothetical protein
MASRSPTHPHQAFQARLAETAGLPGTTPGFVSLEHVAARPVGWLWPGWIPAGRITLLDGDPGLGKSTILLDLAARVSNGGRLPHGSAVEAGGVILLVAEDDLEETVRPRLEAAGANLSRCHSLVSVLDEGKSRPPRLPGDLATLEQRVAETGARLLIVDPFHAFLGDEVNGYQEQSVRACLEELSQMCRRHALAAVLVRHLTKYGRDRPVYRGGGSIGIIALARAGLLLAPDPEEEGACVLAVSKTNLSQTPRSLRVKLETVEGRVCRVLWMGTSPETAASLLGRIPDSKERNRLQEAMDLLKNILGSYLIAATRVYREAATAGVTAATLRRAKEKLGITSQRIRYSDPPAWGWVLPEEEEAPSPKPLCRSLAEIAAEEEAGKKAEPAP